jgi:hypothetical protein
MEDAKEKWMRRRKGRSYASKASAEAVRTRFPVHNVTATATQIMNDTSLTNQGPRLDKVETKDDVCCMYMISSYENDVC